MKKHTYDDKSVGYRYEVGDKIKLSRNFQQYTFFPGEPKIGKGTFGTVLGLLEKTNTGASSIIGRVRIKFDNNKHSSCQIPVWYIKPRDKRAAREAKEITEQEACL